MMPGAGEIKVNKRDLADYFPNETQRTVIRSPWSSQTAWGGSI